MIEQERTPSDSNRIIIFLNRLRRQFDFNPDELNRIMIFLERAGKNALALANHLRDMGVMLSEEKTLELSVKIRGQESLADELVRIGNGRIDKETILEALELLYEQYKKVEDGDVDINARTQIVTIGLNDELLKIIRKEVEKTGIDIIAYDNSRIEDVFPYLQKHVVESIVVQGNNISIQELLNADNYVQVIHLVDLPVTNNRSHDKLWQLEIKSLFETSASWKRILFASLQNYYSKMPVDTSRIKKMLTNTLEIQSQQKFLIETTYRQRIILKHTTILSGKSVLEYDHSTIGE
jgi:hypothetical protein